MITDTDEYDVVVTRAVGFAADLDAELKDVSIVYKRIGGQWVSWVMVAQSAALRSIGIRQYGLYALHTFRGPRETKLSTAPGEKLGRYGGTILGAFANIESPDAKRQVEKWAREGRTSMIAYRVRSGEGVSVVDGHGSGPPFLWRANDARGTTRVPNITFSNTGFGVALRTIPAADPSVGSLAEVAASEILVSYEKGGSGYWQIHQSLGDADNPITFDAHGGQSIGKTLPLLSLKVSKLVM